MTDPEMIAVLRGMGMLIHQQHDFMCQQKFYVDDQDKADALQKADALAWAISRLEMRPMESAPKDGTQVLLMASDLDVDGSKPSIYVGQWSQTAWYGPAWVGYEHRSETEYLTPLGWWPLPTSMREGE